MDVPEDLFTLLELDTVVGSPLPTELLSLGKIPSVDSCPIDLAEQVDDWLFVQDIMISHLYHLNEITSRKMGYWYSFKIC